MNNTVIVRVRILLHGVLRFESLGLAPGFFAAWPSGWAGVAGGSRL